MTPTLYEIFFWIGILVTIVTLCGLFSKGEASLYVSEYELDRLNGNKY